jgi:hypothetical protein
LTRARPHLLKAPRRFSQRAHRPFRHAGNTFAGFRKDAKNNKVGVETKAMTIGLRLALYANLPTMTVPNPIPALNEALGVLTPI